MENSSEFYTMEQCQHVVRLLKILIICGISDIYSKLGLWDLGY